MPLEAVAINSFDAPIIREPARKNELALRVADLLAQHPEFDKGEDAIALFTSAFKRGGLLYVGMFNDKPIAVMGCFDDGQTDSKRLQYLAVHPQNHNRGIEGKFIKQVYDCEVKKGVRQFVPVDSDIHQIMAEYELLSLK
ncbi:hypothetical protein [Psychrobacter sp. I-STPA10]|uniref:hypothetical protein n=1 Tax=Psychrobacter sp. I-STPA10 TaxID=2585769 RepID=UPI001E503732|nr:hypothetical protein [Psychrobacter sp. I-STPA10]